MASFRGMAAGTVGGAAVGALGYGMYEYNQGGFVNRAQSAGYGAAGIGIGLGAIKIARSGGAGIDKAKVSKRAAAQGMSYAKRMKAFGLGMGAGSAVLGYTSVRQAQQGDYKNSAILGGGALVAGVTAAKTFSGGRNAGKIAKGIMSDVADSENFAARAARLVNPRRFGTAAMAAGALTMSGSIVSGVQGNSDFGSAAKGVGIGAGVAAGGALLRSSMSKRIANNTSKAGKALERGYKGAQKLETMGIAESVTKLRSGKGMGKVGKTAVGAVLAGGAILGGYMSSQLGLFGM